MYPYGFHSKEKNTTVKESDDCGKQECSKHKEMAYSLSPRLTYWNLQRIFSNIHNQIQSPQKLFKYFSKNNEYIFKSLTHCTILSSATNLTIFFHSWCNFFPQSLQKVKDTPWEKKFGKSSPLSNNLRKKPTKLLLLLQFTWVTIFLNWTDYNTTLKTSKWYLLL